MGARDAATRFLERETRCPDPLANSGQAQFGIVQGGTFSGAAREKRGTHCVYWV